MKSARQFYLRGGESSLRRRAVQARNSNHEQGSVLIIVLWIAFGLVSIALYFAHSMKFELRASDNRVASLEAEQAIEGAAIYVNSLLTIVGTNGAVLDPNLYHREAWPVGEARFWFIGRGDRQALPAEPFFGLVDEASKLNLNTATLEMLQTLPRMTPELAAAIIDWRDTDTTVSQNGAESEIYQRLPTPYQCKNGPFETVEELRLVRGATLDLLYGEDSNWNGVLDPNEDDGLVSLPIDDRDGQLDPGILDYVTVYSRQPNTRTNINVTQQLTNLFQQTFGADRAIEILGAGVGTANRSVIEFYLKIKSRITAEEFARIETSITTTNTPYIDGLVNVSTASAEVLACIPGIGTDRAQSVVAYRQSNPDKLDSVTWVTEVLEPANAIQAGRYLTAQSYQFTADIAGVGHRGRGYSRTRFIFDTSEGAPKIRYRQDLTHLGWALGRTARQTLELAKEIR